MVNKQHYGLLDNCIDGRVYTQLRAFLSQIDSQGVLAGNQSHGKVENNPNCYPSGIYYNYQTDIQIAALHYI